MMDAIAKMRGKPGSTISLTLVREGGQPFDVKLTRAVIKVRSVKSQLLSPVTGTCVSPSSRSTPARRPARRWAKLKKDNGGKKLNGLVLDLRNNPGGVLQAAVERFPITSHQRPDRSHQGPHRQFRAAFPTPIRPMPAKGAAGR